MNFRSIVPRSARAAFGSEPEILTFALKDLVSTEIVKAGMLDRYLEAKLASESMPNTVHIMGKRLEEIEEAIQKVKSDQLT